MSSKSLSRTTAASPMIEEIEGLLRLNIILSLVPILVGVGVTHLMVNVRRHRHEFEDEKKIRAQIITDVEVISERVKNLRHDVDRLRNIHEREGG